MDIVLLRNVLSYFDGETRKNVLQRVSRLLREDGYLFLGSAETPLCLEGVFERIPDSQAAAFRLRSRAA